MNPRRGEWKKAFLACRKHRIELSVLVEADVPKFIAAVPEFIQQIDDVDHFNLFLTGVSLVPFPATSSAIIANRGWADVLHSRRKWWPRFAMACAQTSRGAT
jgi:hypothetical protein